MIYDRMNKKGESQIEIGKNDGVFWMSINDFFINFEQLFLCRLFTAEYRELTFRSEWSKLKRTAGGCSNNPTVG